MKILFVCTGNTGRSQIAAAIYNQLTGSLDASSAGTKVGVNGGVVSDRPKAKNVIQVMKEIGIAIAAQPRKQLERSDTSTYDKIIVMAEPETIPEWLSSAENYIYWKIEDPADMNLEGTRQSRDVISAKIHELLP